MRHLLIVAGLMIASLMGFSHVASAAVAPPAGLQGSQSASLLQTVQVRACMRRRVRCTRRFGFGTRAYRACVRRAGCGIGVYRCRRTRRICTNRARPGSPAWRRCMRRSGC